MESVGAYEAETHLPKLLDRVVKGERFVITKHGVPVAILQPAEALKKADPKLIISELRKFRDKHVLRGLTIREMIEAGRR